MTDTATLAARLAQTAAGTFGEEAAVWLLTQHGHWLEELDRVGLIREQPMAGGGTATAIRAVDSQTGPNHGLIGTRSERQILDVAMALYRGQSTPLYSLDSLDEENRRLVLHAIAWAAGGRDWARSLGLLKGMRCGTCEASLRGMRGAEVVAHMATHGTES